MVGRIEIESAELRGEQRGEKRGIQQGMQQVIYHQIEGRLGEVPSDVATRLSRLSAQELSDLSVALFDLHSYDDIEAWLARN